MTTKSKIYRSDAPCCEAWGAAYGPEEI